VFVVPEYNHGYNAATKNALDYLHREWRDKPVGFVSYGGIAAGTRAVEGLIQVVTTLGMVPVSKAVNIPLIQRLVDADNVFKPNDRTEESAVALLDELSGGRPASDPRAAARPRTSAVAVGVEQGGRGCR